MVSPRLVDTAVVAECAGCGYRSNVVDDFIPLTSGALCHSCYDDTVGYNHAEYLYEEKARKSRAFADSVNTDYFD